MSKIKEKMDDINIGMDYGFDDITAVVVCDSTIDVPLDETQAENDIKVISGFADKNDRLTWKRKMKRIEDLIVKIEPLNQQALDIILLKQPILDEIEKNRLEMVKNCIHPEDLLTHKGTHILCKFCGMKINPIRIKNDQ